MKQRQKLKKLNSWVQNWLPQNAVSFFQGVELQPSRNILINEYSLVIQSVNRSSAGKYVCVAYNEAGTGSSDLVFLDVKCKYLKNLFLSIRQKAAPIELFKMGFFLYFKKKRLTWNSSDPYFNVLIVYYSVWILFVKLYLY